MFSKKILVIVGVILLIAINIIVLSINKRHGDLPYGIGRIAIYIIAPFQNTVTHSIRFVKNVWSQYFFLISVAKENENLKKALSYAIGENEKRNEIELTNYRLRKLLNFKKTIDHQVLPAEIVGKDPSPWYQAILIDKGKSDGVEKGQPVVIPEGIAGQVTEVLNNYSKVLLIIDQNSAVDALVQRTRARGVIKGDSTDRYLFKYVLRKHDVRVGDTIVSSGLDGVFPKGLRIGYVSEVVKPSSGIFQDVTVAPFIDFEKLEEVLVLLNPLKNEHVKK
jgi:rod shape-determining protein MreC